MPWKLAVERFLRPLLQLGLPAVHDAIDQRHAPEFLDTELQGLGPEHAQGGRTVDKLGNRKLPLTPVNNPVREAYRLWNNALEQGRSSWDQVAVLHTARPQLFEVQRGTMSHTSGPNVVWKSTATDSKHYRVLPTISQSALAELIEDLMAQPPGQGR